MKDETTMIQIVARHQISIVNALNAASTDKPQTRSIDAVISIDRSLLNYVSISVLEGEAELLCGLTTLIASSQGQPNVYFIYEFDEWGGDATFRFSSTLDCSMVDRAFVAAAIKVLFKIVPNESDLVSLSALISQGLVSRSNMLKALLCSEEFIKQNVRLVIVPDTSRWFRALTVPAVNMCFVDT